MNTEQVWESFDQATLDREYSAASMVPSLEPYFKRYAEESARVRATLACTLDLAYGPTARERIDLFSATKAGAPLLVYLHGGYWRRMSKDDFSFFAEPFVRAGAAVAIPSYTLAPAADLDEIVAEMRLMIGWLQNNAATCGGHPQRIVLVGHSAGGQLAGILAGTDWGAQGLAHNPIVAVCGIGGLYDLEPVRRSNINEWLHLPDEDAARRNSPILNLPSDAMPLVAAVGEFETSEFQRQCKEFAIAWRMLGYPSQDLVLVGLNHYDAVLDVLNPSSSLAAAIRDLLASADPR